MNPFFPSQKLRDELKASFDVLLSEYPSGMRINSLLIAKYFHIKNEYAVAGNGAAELIKALMENLEGKIGVVLPTFEEYPNRYNRERIVSFVSHNSDYSYTTSDLELFFNTHPVSVLVLINPDNPSGNFIPYEELLSLIAWAQKKNIFMVVDESFVDFSVGYENNTLLRNDVLEQYENLAVMKSISKSLSLIHI